MTTFFVLNGEMMKRCAAFDLNKAAEIIRLIFASSKAFVVDNAKIKFLHNMAMEEAETLCTQNKIEIVPEEKPVAKKTKVKSKVKVKAKKKPAKKTKVKSKAKKKTNKKPANKKPAKAKAKAKAKKKKAKRR